MGPEGAEAVGSENFAMVDFLCRCLTKNTPAPVSPARSSTPIAMPAAAPGLSSEKAVVDEKVHVWPAQGDCPAAQPHGAEPRPCDWVAEAVAPKESVVVGVPEVVGVGVFEAVAVVVGVVVAVSELVPVGDGVIEEVAPKESVFVGVPEVEEVSELVGEAVGVFDTVSANV